MVTLPKLYAGRGRLSECVVRYGGIVRRIKAKQRLTSFNWILKYTLTYATGCQCVHFMDVTMGDVALRGRVWCHRCLPVQEGSRTRGPGKKTSLVRDRYAEQPAVLGQVFCEVCDSAGRPGRGGGGLAVYGTLRIG